jgi:hypothetical protein
LETRDLIRALTAVGDLYWDGERGGNVRVISTIDDGGLRAFVPLSDSFIKAADGSFVGEA